MNILQKKTIDEIAIEANRLYDHRYFPRIDRRHVEAVLGAFIDIATEGLIEDGKVVIPNLGTINIHEAKIKEHYINMEDLGFQLQPERKEKRATFRMSSWLKSCLRRGSI